MEMAITIFTKRALSYFAPNLQQFSHFIASRNEFKGEENSNYIIISDSMNFLNEALSRLKKNATFNSDDVFSKKYIVIFVNGQENPSKIFEVLCSYDILQAIVLVYEEKNGLELPIYKSVSCRFGGQKLRHNHHVLGHCFEHLSLPDQVFGDIKNRNLKLLLHKNRLFPTLVDPYIKPHPGILISLLHLIGERIRNNVSVVVTNLTSEEIINNKTDDILLVYFLARYTEYYKKYDLSNMIYQDQVIWIVPKAEKMSASEIIASLFTLDISEASGIILILFSLIWFAMNKYTVSEIRQANFSKSLLYSYSLMVCSSNNLKAKTTSLKILLLFYAICCLNSYTIFQAAVTSLLLNPKDQPGIHDVREMLDSNLVPVVSKLAYRQLNVTEEPLAKLLIKKCKVSATNITYNLMNVAHHRNSATFIGEELLDTYEKERALVKKIQFNAGLQDIEVSFGFRKGHPFKGIIDEIITRAKEAGLIEKWLRDVGKFKYRNTFKRVNVALTVDHLKAIVIVWTIGLCMSTAAFIGEIFIYKKRSPQRPFINLKSLFTEERLSGR